MAEITELLPEFPSFAVRYEPGKNPFFKAIMIENLRKLKSVALGRTLLEQIAAASPKHRGGFPEGVNVMCVPHHVNYTAKGFARISEGLGHGAVKVTGMKPSAMAEHNLEKCDFHIGGSSLNRADNPVHRSKGSGSVCWMAFSNAQMITSKGMACPAYIVLAHELIHSLHCTTGTHHGAEEEKMASGIGTYSDLPMTENAFRKAFGLSLRLDY